MTHRAHAALTRIVVAIVTYVATIFMTGSRVRQMPADILLTRD